LLLFTRNMSKLSGLVLSVLLGSSLVLHMDFLGYG
jgi:hypothetical protein